MLRVRAVVMTRDDSSGGWVPMGGGGLSHVTVTKARRAEDGARHRQYLICGERLRDQTPILECAVKRDLVYNKVNPIFHHWKVGESKFGLTFQSPADAAAFERGVQGALEALAAGSPSSSSSSSSSCSSAGDAGDAAALSRGSAPEPAGASPPASPCPPPASPCASPRAPAARPAARPEMLPALVTIVTSESSASGYGRAPAAEAFGFGTAPGAGSLPAAQALPLQEAEELETLPPCKEPGAARGYEDYRRAGAAGRGGSTATMASATARVRFEKAAEAAKGSPSCRIHGAAEAPSRCVYCRDVFSREENGRGQCRDAPDPAGRCVRRLSCLWCAESLLYHCMSDAEGDFSAPCSCDRGHPHCCARWLALAALALLVPCLCCYLPLRACHWCGGHCGCCGGRHKAVR
ncbi:sprouty-related, EVH1 domain-containing protein 3 [Dromaius novaehollandiae]|uniref:sprouty-related, EVH1 domain-containing protein 3 n=1 Tax=Dromaius novaehollandiae TaxID=8790 RepID=UPI00311D697C